MPRSLQQTVEALQRRFGGQIHRVREALGETAVEVSPEALAEICRFLKDQEGFNQLIDITAVDYLGAEPRFKVVYHLGSISRNLRLRLKAPARSDDPTVPSVTGVWKGADWMERETYDLFGIQFEGHPDPRRIFMPQSYPFHPLRKDFPIEGIEPEKYIFDKE